MPDLTLAAPSLDSSYSFRNLLTNPNGLIYSRSAASTDDDAYFADNWYILSQSSQVTPSALNDPENGYIAGIRITQNNTAQRFGYAQIIESNFCRSLRGKYGVFVPRIRVSTSQSMRYAILGWTGTADSVTSDVVNDWTSSTYTAGNFFLGSNLSVIAVGSETPSAATWTSLTPITGACGSSFNNLIVMVWTEGTAATSFTLDFDWNQFEEGSAPTPFEVNRPYDYELRRCARYLPCIRPDAQGGLAMVAGTAVSSAQSIISFIAPTRIQVTGVTGYSASSFSISFSAGSYTLNSVTFVSASLYSARLTLGSSSTLFIVDGSGVLNIGGSSGKLIFTGAEL